MKLAGDLAEFSLADLVQVAGLAKRTCGVKVLTAAGNGVVYLIGGEVVSAVYEDLQGFEAFVALMAAHAGHFEVENDAAPPRTNLQGNVQRLLLAANGRIEMGTVPQPRRRERKPAQEAATAAAATAADAAESVATAKVGAGHRTVGEHRSLWFLASVGALVLLAAASWLAFARHDLAAQGEEAAAAPAALGEQTAATTATPAALEAKAVEATRLTGAGDALPDLLAGTPPAAPDPASGLKPTIVCRLLIDAQGRVAEARIYRSRLDLAAAEELALDAVQKYRFSPGRKAGRPVPVWMNWPMTLR